MMLTKLFPGLIAVSVCVIVIVIAGAIVADAVYTRLLVHFPGLAQ